MIEAKPKITVQCQNCGFLLRDYPAKARTLPLRCPKCGNSEDKVWKEIRPRLYVPVSAISSLRPVSAISSLRRK